MGLLLGATNMISGEPQRVIEKKYSALQSKRCLLTMRTNCF